MPSSVEWSGGKRTSGPETRVSAKRGKPTQNVGHNNGTHAGKPARVGYAYRHRPVLVADSSSVTPPRHPAMATHMSRRVRHVFNVATSSTAMMAAQTRGLRKTRQTPPTATTVLIATWRRLACRESVSGMADRVIA